MNLKYIVCTAPSKTFNLAGIQTSCIIVPDKEMRKTLAKTFYKADIMPNVFALTAMTAAYNEGEEWLEQLLEYLEGNIDFIESFIAKNMPEVKFRRPEGTYLAWLDFESYGWNKEELKTIILEKADLALDDGYIFGDGGETCQRINFACPRSLLHECLKRISEAIKCIY
jgi:cystathionine beta-lyase